MNADAKSDGTKKNVSWGRWGWVSLYLLFSLLLALAFVVLIHETAGPDGFVASAFVLFVWGMQQWESTSKSLAELKDFLAGETFNFRKNLFSIAAPLTVLLAASVSAADGVARHIADKGEFDRKNDRVLSKILAMIGSRDRDDPVDYERIENIVNEAKRNVGPLNLIHFVKPAELATQGYLQNVVFPVRFPNASLSVRLTKNEIPKDAKWGAAESNGLKPRDRQRGDIRNLLESLAPCARDATNPVILKVTGFASSLNFSDYPKDISNELNTFATNERAKNVRIEICSVARGVAQGHDLLPDSFFVREIQHTSHEEMVKHRMFNDRPLDAKSGNRSENFNRSVAVEVVDAGSCRVGIAPTLAAKPASLSCESHE